MHSHAEHGNEGDTWTEGGSVGWTPAYAREAGLLVYLGVWV